MHICSLRTPNSFRLLYEWHNQQRNARTFLYGWWWWQRRRIILANAMPSTGNKKINNKTYFAIWHEFCIRNATNCTWTVSTRMPHLLVSMHFSEFQMNRHCPSNSNLFEFEKFTKSTKTKRIVHSLSCSSSFHLPNGIPTDRPRNFPWLRVVPDANVISSLNGTWSIHRRLFCCFCAFSNSNYYYYLLIREFHANENLRSTKFGRKGDGQRC